MNILVYSYPITLFILCPLVFAAGFVDSIAGGGGLISLPAYIFARIPIHICYGTNKFVNGCGTLCASINYFKNNCVNLLAAFCGAITALIGSAIGAHLALSLSPKSLQICLLIILPIVTAFMVFKGKKDSNNVSASTKKCDKTASSTETNIACEKTPLKKHIFICISILAGFIIGTYDGFFGPGTGMFLTLILNTFLHLNLVTASGTTKIINLASNIGSAITFLLAGKILFIVTLPCLICSILGNYIGSKLAIKNGAKIIRPIIVVVAILLIIHIIFDFLGGNL